jgi:hypothetical protein
MMTGLAGAAMWVMMGLMVLGVVAGAVTWTRRQLQERHDHQSARTHLASGKNPNRER